MSQASDAFSTIDAQSAQIKADHAAKLRDLGDQFVAAQLEASLSQRREKDAISARIEAEKRTARLQGLFAVIVHVLDEARKMDAPIEPTPLPRNELNSNNHEGLEGGVA